MRVLFIGCMMMLEAPAQTNNNHGRFLAAFWKALLLKISFSWLGPTLLLLLLPLLCTTSTHRGWVIICLLTCFLFSLLFREKGPEGAGNKQASKHTDIVVTHPLLFSLLFKLERKEGSRQVNRLRESDQPSVLQPQAARPITCYVCLVGCVMSPTTQPTKHT